MHLWGQFYSFTIVVRSLLFVSDRKPNSTGWNKTSNILAHVTKECSTGGSDFGCSVIEGSTPVKRLHLWALLSLGDSILALSCGPRLKAHFIIAPSSLEIWFASGSTQLEVQELRFTGLDCIVAVHWAISWSQIFTVSFLYYTCTFLPRLQNRQSILLHFSLGHGLGICSANLTLTNRHKRLGCPHTAGLLQFCLLPWEEMPFM